MLIKKNKKLVITDLGKDWSILIKNADIITLNYGSAQVNGVNFIDIKSYYKKFFSLKKKEYLNTLKKYLQKKNFLDIHPVELDIANCRNEKYDYIHKIINIIILKEVIKDYQEVEVICDDCLYYDSYKSLSKKIKITYLKNKKRSFYVLKFLTSRLYFFLKTFLFILVIKNFKDKKDVKTCKEINLTFHPAFFKNDEDYMYRNNKKSLNFLITDETHLYMNLVKLFKEFFKINSNKNIIVTEKYIELKDIFQNFFSTFGLIEKLRKNNSFKINNIIFDDIIFKYFYISLLNRAKLSIYTKALPKITNKYKVKKLNYIMFEYSFGFFLKKILSKNIFFVGYQHGYYSDNSMWLSFVSTYKDKDKNKFLPDKVICKNILSYKSYKKKIPSNKLKIDKENKVINKIFDEIKFLLNKKKITKKSNFLIICGAYDVIEIVSAIKIFSLKDINKNKKFFLKVHPKITLNMNVDKYMNIKIIKKLGNTKFDKVIITSGSTMTTEAENNLKNYYIIGLPFKHSILPSSFPSKKIFNIY
tara:strand:- start:3700 stop:5289 length:1590 start_codon:yes stop_codon:yes gene_type:complete